MIETENTPNPDTLKFLPGKTVSEIGPVEFLKGDNSTVLILEEGDKIQMLSDVADPIVTISVLQQDRT